MKKILLLLTVSSLALTGQTVQFKIAYYNCLHYSPSNIDQRHPYYREIVNDMQPDILVCEEFSGVASANMFRDSVLNIDSTTYGLATFVDGPDQDVSLYYKLSKFNYLNTTTYPTDLRDIYRFDLMPVNCPDTLHVFGLHLKASSGSANEARRDSEIVVLRNITDQFHSGSFFIVGGDFNFYSSNEPAYTDLKQVHTGTDGEFIDQFNMPGTWNNPAYAQYHTQSPRATQFGGGASGGMDDRFDLILMSQAIDTTGGITYVPNSMYAYGNDGQHYNKSINDLPTNTAVSAAIADALYYASDHIPIVASFEYTPQYSGINEFAKTSIFISQQNGEITIHNPEHEDFEGAVYALDGRLIKKLHSSSDLTTATPHGICILILKTQKDGTPLLMQKIITM